MEISGYIFDNNIITQERPSYDTQAELGVLRSALLRFNEIAWIISGPRLVQTQAALNEAVYVILRIQGSEAFGLTLARP